MRDGYYWYRLNETDDWEIALIETYPDAVARMSGFHGATKQLVLYMGNDAVDDLKTLQELQAAFQGPLTPSIVPGITSAQLQQAIDHLRARAQADTPQAEALTLAAEALAMVESGHE
jgi:hypothetical protein